MKREILFRGQLLDNGKWVYGYVAPYTDMQGNHKCRILTDGDIFYEVDPETLGQYTGLNDKNGNKIFEGDIVKCNNKVKVEEYIGIVDWDNCNPSMCIRYKSEKVFDRVEYDFIICGNMTLELWGNRWDNPELLKGGENGKETD